MVTVVGHGGSCCGARHLRGFGTEENRNPDTINAAQATVDRWRMTEVILNGTQVRDYPQVLTRLADLGYVLTAHYVNGNHNSDNYVFHRCDNRRPLIDARGQCVIPGWNGAIITPRLEGQLERAPVRNGGIALDAARFRRPALVIPCARVGVVRPANYQDIRRGSVVRINSPRSRRNGEQHTVRSVSWDGYCHFVDAAGDEFRIVRYNCVPIVPNPALNVGAVVEYIGNVANRPRGTRGVLTRPSDGNWMVRWDGNDREQGPTRSIDLNLITPGPQFRDRRVPRVGDRVVWNHSDVRYQGALGTVTNVQNGTNPDSPIQFRAEWDNPADRHNGTFYLSDQITVLTPEQARENPRVEVGGPVELPATRHAEAPDWQAVLAAAGRVAEVAEVPPPAVVLATFHNVYRDGRRGAGYDDLASARGARRGDGRVDRRDVYSDGTVRWIENAVAQAA